MVSKPVFFEEVLDELGGNVVLVPEIKRGAKPHEITSVIARINSRELNESVIVQSFDYETVQRVQQAGIPALLLLESEIPKDMLRNAARDSIEWCGVSTAMTHDDMRRIVDSGMKLCPYTLPTAADSKSLPPGVAGFFTDDPWTGHTD